MRGPSEGRISIGSGRCCSGSHSVKQVFQMNENDGDFNLNIRSLVGGAINSLAGRERAGVVILNLCLLQLKYIALSKIL